MELNIARINTEKQLFIIYPDPEPATRPRWILVDSRGRAAGMDTSRDIPGEVWVAADRAAFHHYGRPIDERDKRIAKLQPCALKILEELGWAIKYGDGAILLPHSRVWFPAGRPEGFPARGSILEKLLYLADAARKGEAEIIPVTYNPRQGVVLTASS